MSISAAAVIGIISLVASIATSSASAASAKKAGDEEAALTKEQEREEARRRDEVRKVQKRESNMQGLERQMAKRRGAEQVARQVPGARPINRGKLEAPTPSAEPVRGAPQKARLDAPETLTAPKADTGISPEGVDAISGGVKLAGQVGAGITGAAAASSDSRARQEEADRLARLKAEEFKKDLAAKTRDVNLSALDFQDRTGAGAGAGAKQNTFATDFMKVLRSSRNRKVA